MLNSSQKTATAVAHCKRGNGLLKVNGKPLEMLEPATLQYKVSSRLGGCSGPVNQLLCVILGWHLRVPAAPGARVAAGEGALCWSWHQSQSEGWWTCRTSLRSEGNSCFPKRSNKSCCSCVFNPMVLYLNSHPPGHLQSPGCLLPEMWVYSCATTLMIPHCLCIRWCLSNNIMFTLFIFVT